MKDATATSPGRSEYSTRNRVAGRGAASVAEAGVVERAGGVGLHLRNPCDGGRAPPAHAVRVRPAAARQGPEGEAARDLEDGRRAEREQGTG
jgi:hypothetical protein